MAKTIHLPQAGFYCSLPIKALQRDLAATLADGSEVYHVLDTTLIAAVVRAKACRKGLFAGQATFGRCVAALGATYFAHVRPSVLYRRKAIGVASVIAGCFSWSRPLLSIVESLTLYVVEPGHEG